MLHSLGLLPTLLWYFDDFTERTGVPISFNHSGLEAIELPAQVRLTAYRIVQEALTNIVRHSGAEEAYVTISGQAKRLHLRIEDRGRGFDPALLPASSSGIRAMRARAESVGGSLRVESAPGRGTSVIAELPVEAREETSGEAAQ